MVLACANVAHAGAQAPPSPPSSSSGHASGDTSFLVENVTRAELWRFFDPHPSGGNEPDYVFAGNRSTLGATYDGPRWGVRGAIQYVRLENLPRGALGPGFLGNGGAYFFQAADRFSYQFYLRALSLRVTSASRRWSLEAGRLSFDAEVEAGTDAASSVASIEALARERLDGRLLGDMSGSMYERAWDGIRAHGAVGGWRADAFAVVPTQGTYEESANLPLDRVRVAGLDVVAAPDALVPGTRVSAFVYGYRDTRTVRVRPDNSGLVAPAADVGIATVGGSAVGAYPVGAGTWDMTGWLAGQVGDWYGQRHRAWSLVAEGGFTWRARIAPRLRAGLHYASGDESGRDDRHTTFFPLLPSGDRFVKSSVFAPMNVVDAWSSLQVTPHARVQLQAAVHRVRLAASGDRWYFGSGATERRGDFFGYLGRNVLGERDLGAILEAETVWTPVSWWRLHVYAAHMAGGEAVRAVFAGDRLFTARIESRVRF